MIINVSNEARHKFEFQISVALFIHQQGTHAVIHNTFKNIPRDHRDQGGQRPPQWKL